MKKILSIIVVAAVMSLAATSCKEAPKETQPAVEVETTEQDPVAALCLADTSRNPIEILEKLMSQPDCPMHGPTHLSHTKSKVILSGTFSVFGY